jgi:putative alpha-1,2-mannosidase
VSRLGLVCGLALCAHAFKSPPAQYDSVDPLIGTSGDGNTFPGATLPFGMIQWSPDTNPTGSYLYGDNKIYGFSLTHLSGAGCAIYGDVPILPWSDDLVTSPATNRGHYVQPFDHTREESRPGYY